ncbi:MAG: hypothetical protein WDZ35_15605 [Crocinitomicaceae bacterium]
MKFSQLLSLSLKILGIFILTFAIPFLSYFLETLIEWDGIFQVLIVAMQLFLFLFLSWLLIFRTEKVQTKLYKTESEEKLVFESSILRTAIIVSGVIVSVIAIWDWLSAINLVVSITLGIDRPLDFEFLITTFFGPVTELLFGLFLLFKYQKISTWVENCS